VYNSSEDHPHDFIDLTTALGADEIEIRNAGHLAKVMARLPARTRVVLAECTRIDPRLREDDDRRTAITAQVVMVEAPDITVETDPGDDTAEYSAFQPAVQLGAAVISQKATCLPPLTVPLPAQQQAEEAVAEGELEPALAAYVHLLTEIASTLATPADDHPESAHIDRIEDVDLRNAISIEAEQIGRAAWRLEALHARVADYETVAELIYVAEEIVRSAAVCQGHSEPEDSD
jgi:hypothetical protein